MHIAVVTGGFYIPAGIPSHVRDLVKYLSRRASKVTVFSPDARPSSEYEKVRFVKIPKIHQLGQIRAALTFMKILSFAYKQDKFNVFHVHDSIAFISTYLYSRLHNIPTVFTFHGCIFIPGRAIDYSRSTTWQCRFTNRFCARKADIVIGISREMVKGAFIAGAKKEKVYLLPGFVDTELFKVDEAKRFKGPNERKICLYVGALRPTKGIEYLIKAIPNVIRKIENVKFLIIGGGKSPYRGKIFDLVNQLKISSYIEFKGKVARENLPQYYQEADLFILPSINEPQGLVILEAMASGLPIVATKVGGIPEMVTEDYNGTLVPPADPTALAQAIIRILTSKIDYERYSRNALYYTNNYPRDQILDKLLILYMSLLKQ